MKRHKIMLPMFVPMLGIGKLNFEHLLTLKSNIFSTRKLRVL